MLTDKLLLLSLAAVVSICVACAQQLRKYPEQTRFYGPDTNFMGTKFRGQTVPASPSQVEGLYGAKVASAPGLGVVLILLWNNEDSPISLDRRSVVLTLPNGERLRPLEPTEILAWATSVGVKSRDEIYARYKPEELAEVDSGVYLVHRGRGRGVDLAFRFPHSVGPGKFAVDYVVQTADGQKFPVQTRVDLVPSS